MRNLLPYRLIIANTLGASLVATLAFAGYLRPVFENDHSRLTFAIVGLFVVGTVGCWRLAWDVSAELNEARRDKCFRAASAREADKASIKIEWLDAISGWLVGLGLLGTVIGFSIALSGIDQASVADASGVQGAVAQLMTGMRVALNTTLLGAALAIWHEVNMRAVRTAMGCLWIDKVRANYGEITARGID